MAEDVNKADEERRRREKARSLSSPSVTTPQPLEAGDNSNSNLFLGNLTVKPDWLVISFLDQVQHGIRFDRF